MDPSGAIADGAAIGAVLGAAYALFCDRRKELGEWIAWGMVWGAGLVVVWLVAHALI